MRKQKFSNCRDGKPWLRDTHLMASFSRTTGVSRHHKGISFWILMKQEMMGGSDISWTTCKFSAPHSREITIPAPHHSWRMLFLMPIQQCQCTKGNKSWLSNSWTIQSSAHDLWGWLSLLLVDLDPIK